MTLYLEQKLHFFLQIHEILWHFITYCRNFSNIQQLRPKKFRCYVLKNVAKYKKYIPPFFNKISQYILTGRPKTRSRRFTIPSPNTCDPRPKKGVVCVAICWGPSFLFSFSSLLMREIIFWVAADAYETFLNRFWFYRARKSFWSNPSPKPFL